jgi:hypothetical protein
MWRKVASVSNLQRPFQQLKLRSGYVGSTPFPHSEEREITVIKYGNTQSIG